MNLETILSGIINAVFFFFGDKIKGFRTIIVNTIALIVGAWEFLNKGDGLFEFLCSLGETISFFSYFCTITETGFYAILLAIIGTLGNVLRILTAAPVGQSASPAELKVYLGHPSRGQLVSKGIAAGSVCMIIVFILKTIFGF